jgi:hypothetical protein
MHREILGLPLTVRGDDRGDHRNHDTLENTIDDNLRISTVVQSVRNRRQYYHSKYRFKGIKRSRSGLGFHANIQFNEIRVYFPLVRVEIEAGLMHFYAATLLYGEFNCPSEFPVDEMPSEERQEELWQMVLKKLSEVGLLVGETV